MIYLGSYLKKSKIMFRKILSITLLGILLVACKENSAEAVQTQETTPATEAVQAETPAVEATPTPDENSGAVQVQPQQNTNAGPFTQQQQQPAPTTGQTAPGWSGKPNPPHGQEGHRCDIQVGAILP